MATQNRADSNTAAGCHHASQLTVQGFTRVSRKVILKFCLTQLHFAFYTHTLIPLQWNFGKASKYFYMETDT
eukprot:364416-Chlamydomonas_euryale.AAC.16